MKRNRQPSYALLCARGRATHAAIAKIAVGLKIPGSLKNTIMLAYVDILLEHHESFRILLEKGQCGTALALMRPIYDTLFRFLWVFACASEDQVKEIGTSDSFIFPNDMMVQIDNQLSTDGYFQAIKKAKWKIMCSFTHSGKLQLLGRVSGSHIRPSYTKNQLQEAAHHVDIALLLIARPFFYVHGAAEGVKAVDTLMKEYGGVMKRRRPTRRCS